jgi:hypothetical protein
VTAFWANLSFWANLVTRLTVDVLPESNWMSAWAHVLGNVSFKHYLVQSQ